MATTAFPQTRVPQAPRSTTLRGRIGYLGVGVIDLTDERAKTLKLSDDRGVEVKRVDPNTPASKAGLKENDVILEVNGKTVENIDQFMATIGEMQPGTKVNLTIWRDGAKQTLSAMLMARPLGFFGFGGPDMANPPVPPLPTFPQPYPFPGLPANAPLVGFEGEALNSQLAEYFGVKHGVLVREVNPRTPAEKAGLKAGDVVTKVNETPVTSPREISGLVRTSGKKTVAFTVVRNKKEMTVNVEVGDDRPSSNEREVL
jgi:serine protease Do